MKTLDFLKNFSGDDFPSDVGMEIEFDRFDPQFTNSELKQMEKAGIIIVNWNKEFFQLTMKAAKLRKDMDLMIAFARHGQAILQACI